MEMAGSLAQRLVPQKREPLDREAFERLYRETRDDLYAYVRYLTGDGATAEDVIAQAFERAFRKRARFDQSRGSARTWVFGIARNAALDELRRRKRTAVLGFDPEDAGHDPIGATDQRLRVLAALAQLEPRQREIVALKFFGGLANDEIARVVGVSTSNAGTQLHRAVTRLREVMGDDE
jgi:RNA polymerase sigma-70 factor (ECF subfamily)